MQNGGSSAPPFVSGGNGFVVMVYMVVCEGLASPLVMVMIAMTGGCNVYVIPLVILACVVAVIGFVDSKGEA